jgi:predicted hydrocarbon binding protein
MAGLLNSFLDKFIFTNALRYTHYNFFLLNVGFSLVPVNILVGLARIQDPTANRKLYSAVKQHVAGSFIQSFQLEMPLEKSLVFLEEFFTASGWGLVKQVDVDQGNKRAIIVVDDNPIAGSLHGHASKPVDHVFRGVLAGIFSHLFQADVDCIEHECMAMGSQRCEFVIKKQADFDFSKEEPREQLELVG